MFTGLVESTGRVVSLTSLGDQAKLLLEIPFSSDLALGDSVSVNGCCLTVSGFEESGVAFDLLAQTLKVTALGGLRTDSIVNLERALRVGDRLGGHFVQGHVDATGSITSITPEGQDHRLEVSLPPEIHRLCIDKGSLAIDGISLTIAELLPANAVFWITPHTWDHTHLCAAKSSQKVNLEADLLAKHVDKLLAARFAGI